MKNPTSFEEYKNTIIAEKNTNPEFNSKILELMEDIKKKLKWDQLYFNEYLHISYAYYLFSYRMDLLNK